MKNLMLPLTFPDEVKELTAEEIGNLVLGLMHFATTGEDPDLHGNEKFLYPIMKNREKQFEESYDRTCEAHKEAGKRGGRPKKSDDPEKPNGNSENQKNQMVFEKTKSDKSNQIKLNQYISSSSSEEDKSDDEKLMDDLRDKYGLGENPQLALVKNSIPSVDQIREYCKVNGYKRVIPAAFHAYYDRKKWQMNGGQIERWWTVVDAWEKNPQQAESPPKHESSFDTDEFLSLALKRSFK